MADRDRQNDSNTNGRLPSGPAALLTPPEQAVRVIASNNRAVIDAARDRILQEARVNGYDDASLFGVHLAYEEAISNAFQHGNRNDPASHVEIVYHVSDESIYMRFTDDGRGFDPASVPDPTCDDTLESLSGRGLLLMRAYMSSVVYNKRGNQVAMMRLRDFQLNLPARNSRCGSD